MAQIINTKPSPKCPAQPDDHPERSVPSDSASVFGSAHQQRQGRRRRHGGCNPHGHYHSRFHGRPAQRQRRHLPGADCRRRDQQDHRRPSAHARVGSPGFQRHSEFRRPRQSEIEFLQMQEEIHRVISGAQFNGVSLLDTGHATFQSAFRFQIGANQSGANLLTVDTFTTNPAIPSASVPATSVPASAAAVRSSSSAEPTSSQPRAPSSSWTRPSA